MHLLGRIFRRMVAALPLLMLGGCIPEMVYDTPRMPVYIEFSPGLWDSYGVFSLGQHQYFILQPDCTVPSDFIWRANSATGYGGVLLISGLDPASGDANAPLAYDLSCPIENSREVRVEVTPDGLTAQCPECESVYNVAMLSGTPTSGPAFHKKAFLRQYQVVKGADGNVLITNRN